MDTAAILKQGMSWLKTGFFPCQENSFKPVFLQRRFLAYCVLFFLALRLASFPFYYFFPKTSFFADIVSSALINSTNQQRQSLGLPLLKENKVLSEAAMQKAADMINKDYFSHISPAGVTPWYWFKSNGYNYRAAGENLAIGFLESEEVQTAWQNSPSHQQNLLNPNFKEIGIAVLKGDFKGKTTTVVVQLFGSPVVIKAQPKTSPLPTASLPVSPKPSSDIAVSPSPPAPVVVLGEEELSVDLFAKEKLSLPERFIVFGATEYDQLASGATTILLLILIGALSFNFFVNLFAGRQTRELALNTAFFVIILLLFNFLDRQTISGFIPHELIIY